MKNSAIKDFSSTELVERVAEERKNLTRLRFGNALSAAEYGQNRTNQEIYCTDAH